MSRFSVKNLVLGTLGGCVGGAIGGLACQLLAENGLYGVALPGALVGLGFGLASRQRHIGLGFVSGSLGLLAGLLTQWKVYSNEPSFLKLVGELKDYSVFTWIMLGVGTLMAFMFGTGSRRSPPRPVDNAQESS